MYHFQFGVVLAQSEDLAKLDGTRDHAGGTYIFDEWRVCGENDKIDCERRKGRAKNIVISVSMK